VANRLQIKGHQPPLAVSAYPRRIEKSRALSVKPAALKMPMEFLPKITFACPVPSTEFHPQSTTR
jgi:hypothetical protein